VGVGAGEEQPVRICDTRECLCSGLVFVSCCSTPAWHHGLTIQPASTGNNVHMPDHFVLWTPCFHTSFASPNPWHSFHSVHDGRVLLLCTCLFCPGTGLVALVPCWPVCAAAAPPDAAAAGGGWSPESRVCGAATHADRALQGRSKTAAFSTVAQNSYARTTPTPLCWYCAVHPNCCAQLAVLPADTHPVTVLGAMTCDLAVGLCIWTAITPFSKRSRSIVLR